MHIADTGYYLENHDTTAGKFKRKFAERNATNDRYIKFPSMKIIMKLTVCIVCTISFHRDNSFGENSQNFEYGKSNSDFLRFLEASKTRSFAISQSGLSKTTKIVKVTEFRLFKALLFPTTSM